VAVLEAGDLVAVDERFSVAERMRPVVARLVDGNPTRRGQSLGSDSHLAQEYDADLGTSSEQGKLCARSSMREQPRLLTVGEAALVLRQSPRSVRDKIAAGEIPALKIGSGPRAPIRVDAAELEHWLRNQRCPCSAGPTSPRHEW
jgi:excisionase family DNA binding protein